MKTERNIADLYNKLNNISNSLVNKIDRNTETLPLKSLFIEGGMNIGNLGDITEYLKMASHVSNGFMSMEDKEKLDGIEVGSNKYIHPDTHPASMIVESIIRRFVTDVQIAAWDSKAEGIHNHHDLYYTKSETNTELDKKANVNHGNHVPTTESANNARFLRNDNTWQAVTPGNIGAVNKAGDTMTGILKFKGNTGGYHGIQMENNGLSNGYMTLGFANSAEPTWRYWQDGKVVRSLSMYSNGKLYFRPSNADSNKEVYHEGNFDPSTKLDKGSYTGNAGDLKTLIDGKANSSHGNHIPEIQSMERLKFLRNDNTWQTLPDTSVSQKGVVQLNDDETSNSINTGATNNAVLKSFNKLDDMKVNKSGDTMVGTLDFGDQGLDEVTLISRTNAKDSSITSPIIRTYNSGDGSTGDGVIISSPTGMIIGSGNSSNHWSSIVKSALSKETIITSDDDIRFVSNLGTDANNPIEMSFNKSGILRVPEVSILSKLNIYDLFNVDTSKFTYKNFDVLHKGNFSEIISPSDINVYSKEESDSRFVQIVGNTVPIGDKEFRLSKSVNTFKRSTLSEDIIHGGLNISENGLDIKTNYTANMIINNDDIGDGVFRVQHGSGRLNLVEIGVDGMLWKNKYDILHSGILDPNNVAFKEHGNHVPTTESANNARFLRNDNTWQLVTPNNIGALNTDGSNHMTNAIKVTSMYGNYQGIKLIKGGEGPDSQSSINIGYATSEEPIIGYSSGGSWRRYIRMKTDGTFVFMPSQGSSEYEVYHSGNLLNSTQSISGLMSKEDKTKLDGISANANNYVHPSSHDASMITESSTKKFVSQTQIDSWDSKAEGIHGYHIPDPELLNNTRFLRNDNTWQSITPDLINAYDKEEIDMFINDHGDHIPNPETANAAKFLRNDNTWQLVTPSNIGAVSTSGSSMSGRLDIKRSTTIGGGMPSDLSNAWLLIGTTTNGIGFDDNEMVCNSGDLIIHGKSGISLRVGGSERVKILTDSMLVNGKKVWHEGTLDIRNYYLKTETESLLNGKADSSHGSHIPTPESNADNARFLRNDNTWQNVLPANIGTYDRNEIDNMLAGIVNDMDWKESVATFADIAKIYPNPEDGWTVNVKDTNETYRFDGTAWIGISTNTLEKVTSSKDGLMSKEDKVRLDNIENGANNYVHPSSHDASMIAESSTKKFVSQTQIDSWDSKAESNLVSVSKDGIMSKEDKTKLDGISANANNYVHPSSHDASMIAESSSKRFVTDAQISAWNSKPDGVHNHDDLYYSKTEVNNKNFLKDKGNVTAIDGSTRIDNGISMVRAYNNGYPTQYGNVLRMGGTGDSEMFIGWSGGSSSTEGKHASSYIRSKRDTAGTLWSPWAKIYTDANLLKVTSSVDGIMSKEDKTKLDGISANANNYVHPSSHDASMITESSTKKFVSQVQISAWDSKAEGSHNHDSQYNTKTEITNLLAGKANSSHGNHIPNPESANAAKFLRNDNTWQLVTPSNIGAYTKSEIDTELSKKANTSHGNHVPTPESANNSKFLRNDNTWSTVSPGNIGAYTKTEVDNMYKDHGYHIPKPETANNARFLRNDNTWGTVSPSNIGAYTKSETDTELSKKANTSHGNHVPATETANAAKFLRNDNTWQLVTPGNIGAVNKAGDTMTGTLNVSTISQVNRLNFNAHSSDSAYICTTVTDGSTTFDNVLSDDYNSDKFRWMFNGTSDTATNKALMTLYKTSVGDNKTRMDIYGDIYALDGTKKVFHTGNFDPSSKLDKGSYTGNAGDLKTLIDGKANSSHGNHIPNPESANAAKFLRNDNTWQLVTPGNIGAYTKAETDTKVNERDRVYKIGATGSGVSYVKLADLQYPIGDGRSLFTALITGASNYGQREIPVFSLQASTRGYSSGAIPADFLKVTNITGASNRNIVFISKLNDAGNRIEIWMSRESYSYEITISNVMITSGSIHMTTSTTDPRVGTFNTHTPIRFYKTSDFSLDQINSYTKPEVDSLLSGKANSSHGNHVPTTESANNARFLRNDNTWQAVTPGNIGAYTKSETDSKVSGWNILQATSAAAGANFNTLWNENRIYRLGTDQTGLGTSPNYGTALVLRGGGDTGTQLQFPYGSNEIYFRNSNFSTSAPNVTRSWSRVWHSGNFDPNTKANSSHGNHVPTTEGANNTRFLRNDNTWQAVTPGNIGAVNKTGDTMTGVLDFTTGAATPLGSKPTALGYGYLGSYGNLRLLADTDSGTPNSEYVQIAASEGTSPDISKGLIVKRDTLHFRNNEVLHRGIFNPDTKFNKSGGKVDGPVRVTCNGSSWWDATVTQSYGFTVDDVSKPNSSSYFIKMISMGSVLENYGYWNRTALGTLRSAGDAGGSFCINTMGDGSGNLHRTWYFDYNPGRFRCPGDITAARVLNAVWNDYAELYPKPLNYKTEPGDIIALDLDAEDEVYVKATEMTSKMVIGCHSDTFGHLLGGDKPPEDHPEQDLYEYNKHKYIPIGLAGRVYAKCIGNVKKGDDLVISEIPGVARAFDPSRDNPRMIFGMSVEDKEFPDSISRVKMHIKG